MAKRANRSQKRTYEDFARQFDYCWACFWRPGLYSSSLVRLDLNIAHIVGGPGRRHDRRAIVRLCDCCHRLSHGDTYRIDGVPVPTLSLSHLIELKQEFDSAWLDIPYLMSLRVKRAEVLVPEHLPEWYYIERAKRRGVHAF